jgi:hypothetical protein
MRLVKILLISGLVGLFASAGMIASMSKGSPRTPIADGTAPVPPNPPMTADGTAPVPPNPPAV